MSKIIKCRNPKFWSIQDEMLFLNWVKRIKAIKISFVNLKDLVIEFKKKPSQTDLKELSALSKRYQLGIKEGRLL